MPGVLTHSPADIIAQVLVDLGLVQPWNESKLPKDQVSWAVSSGKDVDKPDKAVMIKDTQGRDQLRVLWGQRSEMQGFQVMVRAPKRSEAFLLAQQIAIALDTTVTGATPTLDGVQYHVQSVDRSSQVLPLGTERAQSARELFTINAVVTLFQLGS